LGYSIVPSEAAELVDVGERIKAAAAEQLPVAHPENPQIHTINQTCSPVPCATGRRASVRATV